MYKSKPIKVGRPFPDYITLLIVALVIIAGILVFRIVFNNPDGSSQNDPLGGTIKFSQSTKEIIPTADMELGFGNMSLYLPKGATHQAGYVSMTPREPNLYAPAGDAGWTRPLVANFEYRTSPGMPAFGISFFKPVLICFQITQEQWQDFTKRPDAYQVEYYPESQSGARWLVLPRSTKPEKLQICGETYHLSLYALAIMPEEEIPPTATSVIGATPTLTNTPTYPSPVPTKKHKTEGPSHLPPTHPPDPPTPNK